MHILDMEKNWFSFGKQWALPFCFVTCVFSLLEMSLSSLDSDKLVLKNQLLKLKEELKSKELKKMYLTEQINSQTDPAWIEMVLKKELGLVPEGQIKIYFRSSD